MNNKTPDLDDISWHDILVPPPGTAWAGHIDPEEAALGTALLEAQAAEAAKQGIGIKLPYYGGYITLPKPSDLITVQIENIASPVGAGEEEEENMPLSASTPGVKRPRIAAIALNKIGSGEPSRLAYGGKAASLARLKSAGYAVPNAWVIPCEATFSRPSVIFPPDLRELGGLSSERLFSVRSGAPISMPGLLETRLNVAYKDIRPAIREVWDSWEAPRAVEYRKIAGISDSLGTGVIIQQMVPNLQESGVAFTCDPADPEGPKDFAPIIQSVLGTGDKLVGGADSGKTWKLPAQTAAAKALVAHLHRIHQAWGPSDVEWAISTNGGVWMLQWRKLKFAPPKPLGQDDAGRNIVAKGRSIGAPCSVVAELLDATTVAHNRKAPFVAYMEDFAPEMYSVMMRSAGIISRNGGETCHAAIVAREFGKPAISGISAEKISAHFGSKIQVNGALGTVSIAKEDDVATKLAPVAANPVPKRPNIGVQKQSWKARWLLFRFYSTLEAHRRGEITSARRDEIVEEIAHVLASYHYIIVNCEMRHFPHRGVSSSEGAMELIKSLNLLRIPVSRHITCDRAAFANVVPQPGTLSHAIEVAELCRKGYCEFPWNRAYGGAKWGTITKHLLAFLRGEISATIYVDGSFNLHHNGGRAFDKFSWMYALDIEGLLTARQRSFDMLMESATAEDKAWVKKESILEKVPPLPPERIIPPLTKWIEPESLDICMECYVVRAKCGHCLYCEACKCCETCWQAVCVCCKRCGKVTCNCHDCPDWGCQTCRLCTRCEVGGCTCKCSRCQSGLEACGCCMKCNNCFCRDYIEVPGDLDPKLKALLPPHFVMPSIEQGGGHWCEFCCTVWAEIWKNNNWSEKWHSKVKSLATAKKES